jgi:hypothetical protein
MALMFFGFVGFRLVYGAVRMLRRAVQGVEA